MPNARTVNVLARQQRVRSGPICYAHISAKLMRLRGQQAA
jgi:hypothetical protein